ncbi:MAG: magnesium transporter [Gammaproteobacteria bacterium]|uniref:magnesium transporter n=1 Tax=Pseudomaricurvus alcaniphilus TaxID=1166482 RepID=UPI00140BDFF7|nr:magnesium transporter [Pseudomaricurvus alcaniphilus]MBR9910527.1 magnesium transporter [Gammaproteobacteria bacterium]NHN39674.1 magnesium transporter [Pseudomaricurvus alcaniphilus]
MATNTEELLDLTQAHLGEIKEALGSGTFQQVRRLLNGLRPVEIAHLLESSPAPTRNILWQLIDSEQEGEVLQELSEDVQGQILRRMETAKVVEITEGLDIDDIADILQQLPDRVIQEVLSAMDAQDRSRVEKVLSYDEDTAGGMMDTDTITIRADLTLDVVMRYLRRHDELPSSTDNLIVVNRKDEFVGLLPLTKLLTSSPNITVREIMQTDVEAIPATLSDSKVASLFEKHDWISAPVVDEGGKVVGRITIDDVVDVIMEDADHSLMSMAGLDEEEDTFATVARTTPRRAVWLGVNLLTAIIASAVINIYQDTIDKVVALAVLMPIVASMGGVAGSQTLTVVIRGMALGQIGRNNISWLLSREVLVGLLNGLLWALVMAVIAGLWFNDYTISFIIAAALIINLLTAAVAGALLPITLRSLNIDPALAGSVALTTITDVIGFFAFLGLATYFYI